ncbi:hypothetical protein QUC32_07300 [Novosphingobium resinovorum]|uniref:hypothetical protein n=1 Tax=Sphingomonadaceae TaxID=41297 RepID=UPI00031CCDF9|nr:MULTISPECIES: hypothetical protein [Sphingomonadaceae]MBF7014569.1 hypothetical protein [Novosphingobium sp. HR1a]WJM24951.1 hypothetical protein QUC32_07300 [Novosphingobium resinovorum]
MRKATKFQFRAKEIRPSSMGAAVLRLLRDGIAARAQAVGSVPASRPKGHS